MQYGSQTTHTAVGEILVLNIRFIFQLNLLAPQIPLWKSTFDWVLQLAAFQVWTSFSTRGSRLFCKPATKFIKVLCLGTSPFSTSPLKCKIVHQTLYQNSQGEIYVKIPKTNSNKIFVSIYIYLAKLTKVQGTCCTLEFTMQISHTAPWISCPPISHSRSECSK